MGYIEKREGKKGTTYRLIVSQGMDARGVQVRKSKTWKPPRGLKPEKWDIEAEKELARFEVEIETGYNVSKITFSKYVIHYIDLLEVKGVKPQTIENLKDDLGLFIERYGYKDIKKITAKDLTDYAKLLQAPGARVIDPKYNPLPLFFTLNQGRTLDEIAARYNIAWITAKNLFSGGACKQIIAERIESKEGQRLFERTERRGRLEPSVIKKRFCVVKRVLKQAAAERIILHNPAEAVPLPQVRTEKKEPIEREELKRFLEAADNEPLRTRAACYLLAYSGARRGEIIALTWRDIDFDKNEININKTAARIRTTITINETKTGKARRVPLPPRVLEILAEYKKELLSTGKLKKYVFSGKAADGIATPAQIDNYLHSIADKYNLPYYNPHRFRHTAASLLISEGVDVLTVAEVLGHSDIKTTLNTYSHALEEKRREASETMQRLLNA